MAKPDDSDAPAAVATPRPGGAPGAASGPRFGPPTTANPLWRAVVIAGGLFCFSCLLWITAGFGNPDAPGNRWLNRHGLWLVALSGGASLVAAVGAMLLDRSQTRRMDTAASETADEGPFRRGESRP